jgi:2',3'-cyclic-nucleotide 2'-phosphodiesterase (5'-nucleotidase family)
MKKILCLLLSLMLLLGCTAAFAEEAAPGLQKDLIILFTSDVHCGVDQGWGYAGLYAVKEGLSQKYNVLLVDDGACCQALGMEFNGLQLEHIS